MSPDLEPDLVDRIAQDLPADVRPAYYRELNHCRSLPESDEMLRILRAMQFCPTFGVHLNEAQNCMLAEFHGNIDAEESTVSLSEDKFLSLRLHNRVE
jgi:hypothetical protein